ncbi:MAG: 3-dehydroshikimate dehydratase [Lentisphaerae bacterium ADurb.BinA184]|nr:MAG: 3-dehydroshikimate dehydratase [Lentisphaerae bacterium ADurb.BinA184]
MNYAFMTFSTPELTLREVLAAAKTYGYDGIEPRLDVGHRHGIEVAASPRERADIRRQVADSGIALACLATSLTFADPAKTETMLRDARDRIGLAGDLGVPVIRVFGGGIPAGLGREAAIGLVTDSLRRLADHAAERGVAIAMETHDDWCDPRHVAAVMRGVAHPAVAVNWDIMHPVRTGRATIDESFAALRPWIRHLHIHDGRGEGGELTPIGTGIINHRRAIELLRGIAYAGFISGEWINWEDYRVHLPRELATLKEYDR